MRIVHCEKQKRNQLSAKKPFKNRNFVCHLEVGGVQPHRPLLMFEAFWKIIFKKLLPTLNFQLLIFNYPYGIK